jgi:Transcriptional regulatory protein, C terminal
MPAGYAGRRGGFLVELLDAPLERSLDSPTQIDGVAVVHWPEEQARLADLERMRVPRLLLVDADAQPPAEADHPLCDWVREPLDERDLQSRIVVLRSRASTDRPILGDHGVVWRGDVWVALSPIEERLTAAFLARPGRVLSRARLEQLGWPDGIPNARAIDGRIKVLRSRIAPIGVRIHTVRGQGYLVEIQALAVVAAI